jgi:Flp pilus assembly protein TadD
MAGDSIVTEAVVCGNCGVKVRAERSVCPRCRSAVVPAQTATSQPSPVSRRTVLIAASALAISAVATAGVWIRGRAADTPPASRSGSHPDPLANRRTQVPAGPAGDREVTPPAAPPLSEPQAEAAASYSDGNYASAAERYQAAVVKNPDDAEALSNLGQVLVRLGKVEEAIPYFDKAIALIPQRWAYRFNRARALGILGRMEECVAEYREAQRLFPNDYATSFNLGLALHKAGNEAAAVEAYRKAIELDPNDATFRMALGTSLERLQRPRDAADAYNEYLRLAPSAPDAESVRARIAQLTQAAAPQAQTPTQPGNPPH